MTTPASNADPSPASGAPAAPGRYTGIAIALHWLMAAFLVVNLCLGLSADYLPESALRSVIDFHKSLGITLLGLVILRILWRYGHAPPALNAHYAVWERRMAHVVHYGLYAVMVLLPASGWLHDSAWKGAPTHPMRWFGLFEWPRIGFIMSLDPALKETLHTVFGNLHTALGYTLIGLFGLHVAGALKHQWLDREAEIQRMLPGRGRTGAGARQ